MASQEESAPAVETTTQPAESNEAAAPPPADTTATDTAAPTADATAATAGDEAAATAAEPAAAPVIPRVVIVTGASSGLGLEATRLLCDAGHDVIMACRNEDKANRVIDKLKKQNLKGTLTYLHLDLADLESVRKFVDEFRATEKKLSVLVNNAGLALNFKDTRRQYTKDNFELTMGTNHIGHFVLTHLLLDELKKSAAEEDGDARVVIVTSSLHDVEQSKKRGPVQPLDLDNLFLYNDGTYSGLQAYKNSKLANLLFAYELSRKLEGTSVKVNAIDPGFVPATDLLRHASGAQKFYTRYILHGMLRFTRQTRTVASAGAAICAVATGDKFKEVSGKLIRDGAEVSSSEESLDEAKQKKLWELTGGYAHLDGFAALDVPPPPAEPAPEAAEPPKTSEPKAEEANGEAAKESGDTPPVITDSNKTDEAKTDEKGAGDNKEEQQGGGEEKSKEDEAKPEAADKADDN